MTIGSRIKAARLQRGLSQVDLADLVNVSQPTVANWENNSHAPRHLALGKVAESLDISQTWLLQGGDDTEKDIGRPAAYLSQPIQHVPILRWPERGQSFQLNSPPQDYLAVSTDAKSPFALVASDPAMAAEFSIGSLIILDADDIKLRDGAAYLFDQDGELQVRRWRETPARLEPVANIPGYAPEFMNSEPQALARAIMSFRRH